MNIQTLRLNNISKDNQETEEKVKKYKQNVEDKLNFLKFCENSIIALTQKLDSEEKIVETKR